MKRPSAPPPVANDSESSFSFLWLMVGIVALLMVLQVTGIYKTIDSEHKATVMDTRSAEYENRQMPEERLERIHRATPEVDKVLAAIKDEYEAPVFTDIRTANENNNWGLTDDEAKFYDDMRLRYGATRDNWLGVVQRANQTYKMVKEIFGGQSDVATMLQDARTAAHIFGQVQQAFGISAIDCLHFFQSGRANTLSDWANFVESRRKK
jgi:hypothetical protein